MSMPRGRAIASRTASRVISWNATRRTGRSPSASRSRSQRSTCHAIASPSRSGSVARTRPVGLDECRPDDAERARRAPPGRLVDHREAVVGPDRARLRRQVAHQAVARKDPVAPPEVRADRPRLGRRFDDNDLHGATTRGSRGRSRSPRRDRLMESEIRDAEHAPRAGARRRAAPPPRPCGRRPGPRPRWVNSREILASRSCLPTARAASAARRTAFINGTDGKKKMPIAPESIRDAYRTGRCGRRGGRRQGAQALRNGASDSPRAHPGLTSGGAGRPAKPAAMAPRAHPRTGPSAAAPRACAPPRVACGPETAGERPVPASV